MEICPLVHEKSQKGFCRGERNTGALGKGVSHVTTERFISETPLQGRETQILASCVRFSVV